VDPQHFELHRTSPSAEYTVESELQDSKTLGECGVDEDDSLTLRKKPNAPPDIVEEGAFGEEEEEEGDN
jgi:hypothetical protein